MSDIEVITDALREEAKKWIKASDDIAAVGSDLRKLDLARTAFFLGDISASGHAKLYGEVRLQMAKWFMEAHLQFDGMASALRKIADAYDDADSQSALDLSEIFPHGSDHR